jgi:hypothetical protein
VATYRSAPIGTSWTMTIKDDWTPTAANLTPCQNHCESSSMISIRSAIRQATCASYSGSRRKTVCYAGNARGLRAESANSSWRRTGTRHSWQSRALRWAATSQTSRHATPPMDLANMRQNGVRSLQASCLDCSHGTTINVDHLPGHLAVPSFTSRMVCSKCGSKRVDVRPAWGTKATALPR